MATPGAWKKKGKKNRHSGVKGRGEEGLKDTK
jgi:hypothetical protein